MSRNAHWDRLMEEAEALVRRIYVDERALDDATVRLVAEKIVRALPPLQKRASFMKIETTPLKAKIILTLLKDPAIRQFAIQHYALDNLNELIAALEKVKVE